VWEQKKWDDLSQTVPLVIGILNWQSLYEGDLPIYIYKDLKAYKNPE
jgi:hypothetical protein